MSAAVDAVLAAAELARRRGDVLPTTLTVALLVLEDAVRRERRP